MTDKRLLNGEKIIHHGGNKTGQYIVICTGRHHWRNWNNGKQTYIEECTCEK